MTHAIVERWREHLAITLPDEVADELGLVEGAGVEIVARGSEAVLRKAPRLTAEELFAARPPSEWRTFYANSDELGPFVGREIIEE